jgi:hypothetical protein
MPDNLSQPIIQQEAPGAIEAADTAAKAMPQLSPLMRQYWDIKSFDISVQDKNPEKPAPDKAVGTVKFDNDGDSIAHEIVQAGKPWLSPMYRRALVRWC